MNQLEQLQALFCDAILVPEQERAQWMEAHCPSDAIRQEVAALLSARELMNRATEAAESQSASPKTRPIPPGAFGAYRAVELIGRGGMSAVYRAERADGQFQQTVALKVMAQHLAGEEFLHSFETERQLLASLNHNHVTRLLDGGISSTGDPFLITEYVDGQSIDRYCDERRLTVESRLKLFLQVCEAVDYAHRNLILHRDLKPANILVNKEGTVKLLDFGTASMVTRNHVTVTRMRMLTPRYASPEQLRGERVNTASDIFSLGVILYELLCGAWPFGDPASMLNEMQRALGDTRPQSPSTAITDESAEARCLPRQQLTRILEGDLSAICLKALENEPGRRYDSVRALASDVQNFLDGLPVLARPQTVLYRARKFVRRRWLAVSAATVFVVGLAGASIVAVYQARVARAEVARAEAEALKAEKVTEFLDGMLSFTSEGRFDPRSLTVAQMLERAEARLEKNWTGDARTEATLRRSLGNSYAMVRHFDRAEPQIDKALAMFEALHDEKEIATTLLARANLLNGEGRAADAVQVYEQALEHVKHLGKAAPPQLVFFTKEQLANTLSLLLNTRRAEARALFTEAIEIGQSDSSIPRPALALAMSGLGILLQHEEKNDEAEALYRKALAIGRKEDPDGTWQAQALLGLGVLVAPRNRAEGAELARERYELMKRALGPDHGNVAVAKLFWARARVANGETDGAAAQVEESLEIIHKDFSPSSMDRWFGLSCAAYVLNQSQRYKEAESASREMLPILDANHLAENDARRGGSLMELGKALHGQGRDGEAERVLTKALANGEAAGLGSSPNAAVVRRLLNEIHQHATSH